MSATPHVLLINPNSSIATSGMMREIAQRTAGGRLVVSAETSTRNPIMIVNGEQLSASEQQVIEIGNARKHSCSGIIVSAYGDPGVDFLRGELEIPVIGICEASMIIAANGQRKYGVATVTPDLAVQIANRSKYLDLSHLYTGIRCTPGNPREIAGQPERLIEELAYAVELCLQDGAEAVVIGGGPLGEAAEQLQKMFDVPIIAPISSAVELMVKAINENQMPMKALM
ncbi:aspartate/glutamate racemase family protein [Brucella thiophenivorans]|uniref:Asp/Glu/Hydantoin racemase family protein n=1 Tax=Brucella thiophenivorans TaxID=571255 RepID=A0A256G3P8_9HYPH|nr:aspartate/glutamate racemase family protein [Brucella thiophenivorans]OYR21724.1 asp/Glu/Hydantoin racemase family protein [Brucella thiophenivorans]